MATDISYNSKTKDSVFTSLFSDKENVLRLYKELIPEDTDVTKNDIDIQTLESVLAHTIYNDLGFIVKNRFILLVEAQSRWNSNMSLRMAFYLFETYRRYLADTKQSEHYSAKVKLPKPYLYVIYTGNDKSKIPETISLSEDYFDGDSGFADIKAKILFQEDKSTLYGQYICFCKIFNEQYQKYKNSMKCAEETVRICIEKGYLAEYLQKHKKEVISMMAELFNEQIIRENYEMAAKEHERAKIAEAMEKATAQRNAELIAKWKAKGMTDEEIHELLAD